MNLMTKLESIKGVGPKTAELLRAADLDTVGDLIDFLPRAYEDFSTLTPIANLRPGKVTIKARAENISTRFVRRGMRVTTATLYDNSGKVQAVWFNQPYRKAQVEKGEHYFSGEFGLNRDRYQLSNPSVEAVKEITVQTGRILPIYPKRKGLKPSTTRKILDELRPLITILPETLPAEIVKNEKLISRSDAMLGLHFPESAKEADAARERLAFEELFELLLAARLNKQENSKLTGYEIPFSQKKIADFVAKLPFEMTGAQKRALWEILQDFAGGITNDNYLKTAHEIMKKFANVTYGQLGLDNEIHRSSDPDFHQLEFNNYRLQSVAQIEKSKVGVCWDQVEYARELFARAKVPAKTCAIAYYDPANGNIFNHTFLIFMDGGKFYWFEHSMYDFAGIHEFKSFESLMEKVKFEFLAHNSKLMPKEYNEQNLCLWEYDTPRAGANRAEFFANLKKGRNLSNLIHGAKECAKVAPPMNRMLQGDVGSGKTIVAGAAAYQASLAGFQTAFMAPTEILANQHAESLAKILEPLNVSVVLLTGSVKGAARKQLYEKIENGAAAVVVGTHALFQDAVKFHKLGFVVIDEQHRFGVKQRQQLLAKSAKMPHLLAMTATPIPRSLQLTVFGDLDISILNEMPKGRKPIETKIWSPNSRAQLYEEIENELADGRQAYVICPLIESGADEKKSVQDEFKKIAKTFKNRRVGILHGKMPSDAKDEVMTQFAKHEIDILVATTVVEVGVDVPNATVILIENADQFGLSQLHQLRGRVGRGEHQSYCFLMMSDSKKPSQRLREIEKSNDGFYLSEVDLRLRGPGEIYGHAQHGALNLQIANLADTKLIKRASAEADWFINSDQDMVKYPQLAARVAKYQRLTTLN